MRTMANAWVFTNEPIDEAPLSSVTALPIRPIGGCVGVPSLTGVIGEALGLLLGFTVGCEEGDAEGLAFGEFDGEAEGASADPPPHTQHASFATNPLLTCRLPKLSQRGSLSWLRNKAKKESESNVICRKLHFIQF